MSVWAPSGFSGFLPQPEDMHIRLTGNSEASVGVSPKWFVGFFCPFDKQGTSG